VGTAIASPDAAWPAGKTGPSAILVGACWAPGWAQGYLLSRGVEAGKIRLLSYGEGLPVVDTEKRSRENRRIVLMAVQKEPIVETETRTEVVKVPVEKKVYVDRVVEVPAPGPVRRPLGLEVLAGGGVTGFIDDHSTDVTDVGGMWTARVVGRTGKLIGYEAAYVGSAKVSRAAESASSGFG
jgi:hypothetical protein